MTQKYSELHLFIDESGSFNREIREDVRLVGGVLLFGQYDDTVQAGIESVIRDACKIHKRKYPPHYSDISDGARPAFVQTLKNNLDRFQSENNRELYGVVIRYKEDIFSNGSDVLAERNCDNRYLEMCRSLIEHCVFINRDIDSRLTKRAKIHLHIGFRQFPIAAKSNVVDFETFGYKVKEKSCGKQKKFFAIPQFRPAEIAIMFRQTQRFRWKQSKRTLGNVKLGTMSYENATPSETALFLADIFLGVERDRQEKPTLNHPLPVLESLEYGRTLEAAIQCKSYIANGNIEVLLGSLANEPFDANDLRNLDLLNALVKEFKQDKTQFYQLYETAIQNVNHPARRKKGLRLQQLLDAVHGKSGLDDLQMYLHAIQTDMAYHDHTGNVELGDADWEQYLQLEPQSNKLDPAKAMEFYTDFRCKRAVNLMDTFRYNEAGEVLIAAGQKEEKFAKNVSEMFGGNNEDFPKERRGWVYSSLGQVFAFQGNKERAEEMFRNALQCFDKQGDIEREWVYLGHLACDFLNESQALLNEVLEHLPQSTNPLEEPFILALKLKMAYIFGTQEQQKQWTGDILTFVHSNSETLPMEHPWGLIYQMTAMLLAKLGDCEHEKFMFDLAIRSFNQGEGILKDLGKYCQLRKNGKEVPPQIRFNYW